MTENCLNLMRKLAGDNGFLEGVSNPFKNVVKTVRTYRNRGPSTYTNYNKPANLRQSLYLTSIGAQSVDNKDKWAGKEALPGASGNFTGNPKCNLFANEAIHRGYGPEVFRKENGVLYTAKELGDLISSGKTFNKHRFIPIDSKTSLSLPGSVTVTPPTKPGDPSHILIGTGRGNISASYDYGVRMAPENKEGVYGVLVPEEISDEDARNTISEMLSRRMR